MKFQMDGCEEDRILAVIQRRRHRHTYEEQRMLRRSWASNINYIQMEDVHGYGYPFKPIERYYTTSRGRPSMMLWALSGAMLGCKELWQAIDQKHGAFRFNGWEGHMLAHLSSKYLKHVDSFGAGRMSPFSTSTSGAQMMGVIEPFMPRAMSTYRGNASQNRSKFFKFSTGYWQAMFPREVFPTVMIHLSIDDVEEESAADLEQVKVIIVVGCERSSENCTFPCTDIIHAGDCDWQGSSCALGGRPFRGSVVQL